MNNKRYDDALKRAEAILKVAQNQTEIYNCIITIFPELKESCDREIRKDIIRNLERYIECVKDGYDAPSAKNFVIEEIEKQIVWLEKQGQKETTWNKEDEENMNNVLYVFNQVKGTFFYKEDDTAEKVINWLKSLKDRLCSNNEYDKDMLGAIAYYIKNNRPLEKEHIAWLEKQEEQKETNLVEILKHYPKVQPKFHRGDWIVYNRNDHSREILQVYDIRDDRYYFTDNVHFSWSIKECDERSHLWTIQDAKDGDVLATSAGAFIYNGNDGGGSCPGSYCGINTLGKFQIGVEKHWTGKKVYPATKEQCNTLEKAMADAGYMFDVENKELMTY